MILSNHASASATALSIPTCVVWEVGGAGTGAWARTAALGGTGDLDTREGLDLLTRIRREFGAVQVVLAGSDPLSRDDLHALVGHATGLGLGTALAASALPGGCALGALKASGLGRLDVALDGADAATHENCPQARGAFNRAVGACSAARRHGVAIRLTTALTRRTICQLERIADLAGWLGAAAWSVHSRAVAGQGPRGGVLAPSEQDRAYRTLARIATHPRTRCAVATSAGLPYGRVLAQAASRAPAEGGAPLHGAGAAPQLGGGSADFIYIERRGAILPSGDAERAAGNIRSDDLGAVYRQHRAFVELRASLAAATECRACDHRWLCGGGRSHAFPLAGGPAPGGPACPMERCDAPAVADAADPHARPAAEPWPGQTAAES